MTINGGTELICKKASVSKSGAHDKSDNLTESAEKLTEEIASNARELFTLPGEGIANKVLELITLPSKLVSKLERLGEGKVNDIGFIIVHDIHGKEAKLLKSEGYETADISLLDSVKELSLTSTSTVITYKKNPCCKWETDSSGTRTRTCDILAPSC